MEKLETILLSPQASLRDAMTLLNTGTTRIILVVDDDRQLLATITDGDIRRAILAGHAVQDMLHAVLIDKRTLCADGPVVCTVNASRAEMVQLLRQYQIDHLPLIDDQGRVVDLVTRPEIEMSTLASINVHAVIMAGGEGYRLLPLTKDVPKPLLPVGNKPLIERVIEQLRHFGVKKITITTRYQAEQIINRFRNGDAYGAQIDYIHEDQPMGTAGALSLIDVVPSTSLLVINGDVLTSMDFSAFYHFHRKQQSELTVAVATYEMQVPYGVVDINADGAVIKLEEKPHSQFLVNAGIYLLEPAVLPFIPAQQYFEMTDLIAALIGQERSVHAFPIHEYWLDIGQIEDYEQAQHDVVNGKLQTGI